MTAITAKGLEKLIKDAIPGRTALGGGLYLTIKKSGSASFGFRYAVGKSSRLMGLGAFCPVNNTLAIARAKALNIQAILKQHQVNTKHNSSKTQAHIKRNSRTTQATFKQQSSEFNRKSSNTKLEFNSSPGNKSRVS